MDLSIIIVSYNQHEYLKNCIDSIYRQTGNLMFEIMVVDNGSEDTGIFNFLKNTKEEKANFDYILNKSNPGFAAANNIGFNSSKAKYAVFLNPDTIILNNGLKIMTDFLDKNPQAAACGPRILYPDGKIQVSFYSFPTPGKKFLKVIGANKLLVKKPGFLKKLFKLKKIMPEYINLFNANFQDISNPVEVPWVTGACLMVKSNVFMEAGFFDERFKMYCEDMDACLRIRNGGYKIFFIPEAKIIHYRGWKKRSLKSLDFYFESHQYYYQKNFRGIYKTMLLYLNKFEWFYERFFLVTGMNLIRRNFQKKQQP